MELTEISTGEPRCWRLAGEEKTSSFLLGENPSKLNKMVFEWKEGAPAALDSARMEAACLGWYVWAVGVTADGLVLPFCGGQSE